MALGDAYCSLEELQLRLGTDAAAVAARAEDARVSASRLVERYCCRQFNKTTTATARQFRPVDVRTAVVDDFHTLSGLIVETDTNDDGVFEVTWTTADYQLEPFDGVMNGETGWPWWILRATSAKTFPFVYRAAVRVTAQWGWAAVPAPVKEVTLTVAESLVSKEPASVISESIDGYAAAYSGLGGGMTSPLGKLNQYRRLEGFA